MAALAPLIPTIISQALNHSSLFLFCSILIDFEGWSNGIMIGEHGNIFCDPLYLYTHHIPHKQ